MVRRWIVPAAALLLALTGTWFPLGAFPSRPGWFTGVSVGASHFNDAGFDDEALVGDVYMGVQPASYLALEVGYIDLGSFQTRIGGTTNELEAEGFYGDAVIIGRISDRFDLHGKAGLFQWNIERRSGGSTTKGNDADLTFGGGFSAVVSDFRGAHDTSRMEIQGEWTRYRVDSSLLSERGDVDVYSLSLVGHFL